MNHTVCKFFDYCEIIYNVEVIGHAIGWRVTVELLVLRGLKDVWIFMLALLFSMSNVQ